MKVAGVQQYGKFKRKKGKAIKFLTKKEGGMREAQ